MFEQPAAHMKAHNTGFCSMMTKLSDRKRYSKNRKGQINKMKL